MKNNGGYQHETIRTKKIRYLIAIKGIWERFVQVIEGKH